ncbi:MAG: hypothetical protein ACFCU3_03585 [Verrucomicrobiales bacterium]
MTATLPKNDPADLEVPLVVDLDGTLTYSDTAWESFLELLLRKPWLLVQVVVAMYRGGRARGTLSSNASTNLTGSSKAQALAERYPHFDYVGDSRPDLQVWAIARKAWICAPEKRFPIPPEKVARRFSPPVRKTTALLRALRPHQ